MTSARGRRNENNPVGRERSQHTVNFPGRHPQYQTHLPVKAPADGVLRLGPAALGNPFNPNVATFLAWRFNGQEVTPGETGIEVSMKTGEVGILSVAASARVNFTLEWE